MEKLVFFPGGTTLAQDAPAAVSDTWRSLPMNRYRTRGVLCPCTCARASSRCVWGAGCVCVWRVEGVRADKETNWLRLLAGSGSAHLFVGEGAVEILRLALHREHLPRSTI